MKNVSIDGRLIGHVERFPGNNAPERWVAYRPREADDHGAFPRRRSGFPTQREAVAWLETAASSPSTTSCHGEKTTRLSRALQESRPKKPSPETGGARPEAVRHSCDLGNVSRSHGGLTDVSRFAEVLAPKGKNGAPIRIRTRDPLITNYSKILGNQGLGLVIWNCVFLFR